ncbi:unnamed protein product [Peniophora sp. CBMAI 1063]|nr:unnamed protein product [Peniophora sp. CBMAI 1063]
MSRINLNISALFPRNKSAESLAPPPPSASGPTALRKLSSLGDIRAKGMGTRMGMPSIASVLSSSTRTVAVPQSQTSVPDTSIAIRITKTRSHITSSQMPTGPFALTRARMEEEDERAFKVGEVAWARGPNGKWRRVIVVDGGRWELGDDDVSLHTALEGAQKLIERRQILEGRQGLEGRQRTAHRYYGATWSVDRMTFRASFAPARGEMLRNCVEVRGWLSRERWGDVCEGEKGALYCHFPRGALGLEGAE